MAVHVVNNTYQIKNPRHWSIEPTSTHWQLVVSCQALLFSLLFLLSATHVHSAELSVHNIKELPQKSKAIKRPDQLPQSRVAHAFHNISASWFARPTSRYRHGVLGDKLEATRLVVETSSGKILPIDLPLKRVFEDLEPRLIDIDGDGRDEIIVVESDIELGASLAVYNITDGQLVKVAATSFLGRPYRWLNPLGTGDFDGDGMLDVALVATPHIGGVLRLYRFNGTDLSLFAEFKGISTHKIGSAELGLGRVVSASPRDLLLVPDQERKILMLLEWSSDGWEIVDQTELPGILESSLIPCGDNCWRFRVTGNKYFEIQLK